MPLLKNSTEVTNLAEQLHVSFYFWQIVESEEELAGLLPQCYNYPAKAKAKFASVQRRKEWLATRVLLHCVAGIKDKIVYTVSGRPVLQNSSEEISISHSGQYVCVALGAFPFGVDIEQHGERAYRLRQKFIHPAEEKLLCTVSRSKEKAALILWSGKEAVYKYCNVPNLSLQEHIIFETQEQGGALLAKIGKPFGETVSRRPVVRFLTLSYFVLTLCY